jgi:hypothetical protein
MRRVFVCFLPGVCFEALGSGRGGTGSMREKKFGRWRLWKRRSVLPHASSDLPRRSRSSPGSRKRRCRVMIARIALLPA